MGLSLKHLFKRKKEKRMSWIPWQAGQSETNRGTYQAGNLAPLRRGLSLYRDLLMSLPLFAWIPRGNMLIIIYLKLFKSRLPLCQGVSFIQG